MSAEPRRCSVLLLRGGGMPVYVAEDHEDVIRQTIDLGGPAFIELHTALDPAEVMWIRATEIQAVFVGTITPAATVLATMRGPGPERPS